MALAYLVEGEQASLVEGEQAWCVSAALSSSWHVSSLVVGVVLVAGGLRRGYRHSLLKSR
jgi:hypothetical protein